MKEEEGLDTKKDKSLVTTADYAAQAVISWCVSSGYGVTPSVPAPRPPL